MVWIGVWGDVEFTIIVTESNPNDVDTCWIYLNGTTTTGMSRDFTATDYRLHYGMVVIKYDNDEYESKQFRVKPAWDLDDPPETGATAPSSYDLPEDETAADLIEPVAEADPDGPPNLVECCICVGPGCFKKLDTTNECGTYPYCKDIICMNKE